MDFPIACTLTEAELRQRRKAIMDTFHTMRVSATELPDRYAYSFVATSQALTQIVHLVHLERRCCSFLTFKIKVEAAGDAMRLEVTGPEKAKTVIAQFSITALRDGNGTASRSDYGMRAALTPTHSTADPLVTLVIKSKARHLLLSRSSLQPELQYPFPNELKLLTTSTVVDCRHRL